MRRLKTTLFAVVIVIALLTAAFAFSACGGDEPEDIKVTGTYNVTHPDMPTVTYKIVIGDNTISLTYKDATGADVTYNGTYTTDNKGKVSVTYTVDNATKNVTFQVANGALSVESGELVYVVGISNYTVTFKADGQVIGTPQTIAEGGAATAPANPEKAGYRFDGWDVAFSNVSADVTVNAKFVKVWTVTFMADSEAIGTPQILDEGTAATAPTNPEKAGYRFDGWDKEFTNVTADLTVNAKFVKVWTVTFKADGEAIGTPQILDEGEDATAPTNPEKAGYRFDGWDKEFTNVTADLTVNAKFVKVWTVTFKADGEAIGTPQILDEGEDATAPANPEKAGYRFDGWDKEFTNVTADLTVNAKFVKVWTVTFMADNQAIGTPQVLDEGDDATAPADPEKAGYRFDGWDKEYTNVTADLTVNAKFVKVWTVTFKADGEAIGTPQVLDEGGDATAPADPEKENFYFTGWDKDFTNVTADLTVNAVFVADDNLFFVTQTVTDNTVVVKIEVKGAVCFNTLQADLSYSGLTYVGHESTFLDSYGANNIDASHLIRIVYAITMGNYEEEVTVIEVTFTIADPDNYSCELTIDILDYNDGTDDLEAAYTILD